MASKKQRKAQELNWTKVRLLGALSATTGSQQKLLEYNIKDAAFHANLHSASICLQLILDRWDYIVWKKKGV